MWWLKRIYDGATGTGISANILQAYSFIVEQFEVGDELFLFGFRSELLRPPTAEPPIRRSTLW